MYTISLNTRLVYKKLIYRMVCVKILKVRMPLINTLLLGFWWKLKKNNRNCFCFPLPLFTRNIWYKLCFHHSKSSLFRNKIHVKINFVTLFQSKIVGLTTNEQVLNKSSTEKHKIWNVAISIVVRNKKTKFGKLNLNIWLARGSHNLYMQKEKWTY